MRPARGLEDGRVDEVEAGLLRRLAEPLVRMGDAKAARLVNQYFAHNCKPDAYWLDTSSNDLITEIVRDLPHDMVKTLEDGRCRVAIPNHEIAQVFVSDIRNKINNALDVGAGWHEVSFPVLPEGGSPDVVFKAVADKIGYVTCGNTNWSPLTGGTLASLEVGKGYGVYANAAATIRFDAKEGVDAPCRFAP